MFKTKKILLLGSGELGKEVIIEAQRLGVQTVAVDRYADAPAMHVADHSHVIDMLDGEKLRAIIELEKPDLIVPEIEALATSELVKLEDEGYRVIPTARAAKLTMDREGIRRLASEELGLPTADYRFADTYEEFKQAVLDMGFPCVIKPLMSSSGKGQSVCRSEGDIESSWNIAMEGGRVQNGRVIIEEFISFQSEITLLTVRSVNGTSFCAPIGHIQESGDYIESWQPHDMSEAQIEDANILRGRSPTSLADTACSALNCFWPRIRCTSARYPRVRMIRGWLRWSRKIYRNLRFMSVPFSGSRYRRSN